MERLYRWKYNWVINNRMNSDEFIFDLNPHNSKMWLGDHETNPQNNIHKKEPYVFKVMFTKTLIPLYSTLMFMNLMILVVTLLTPDYIIY